MTVAAGLMFAIGGAFGATAGCAGGSSGINCTLVGCSSGIVFNLDDYPVPPGATVTLCANEKCEPATEMRRVSFDYNADVALRRARVLVTGPDGAPVLDVTTDEVHATKFEPNGARCGPTCRNGSVRLTPDGRLVDARQR